MTVPNPSSHTTETGLNAVFFDNSLCQMRE